MTEVVAHGPLADDDWQEDPPRQAPASTTAPVLVVDGFEGPLDWLLEMARARKIDLARLSILALVEAFGEAMQAGLRHRSEASGLMAWASWTVMAAQLVELRSRLLLPADDPKARAALTEAKALRRSLVSRAEIATATDWLDRRTQFGRDVFGRGQAGVEGLAHRKTYGRADEVRHDDPGGDDVERSYAAGQDDLTGLLRACLVALKLPVNAETYQPRRLPFWTVADATRRIQQLLPALPDGASLERFLPEHIAQTVGADPDRRRRAALAATLVASLELARGNAIRLTQGASWQTVTVRRAAQLGPAVLDLVPVSYPVRLGVRS
jgi:segregation and condensation protein A